MRYKILLLVLIGLIIFNGTSFAAIGDRWSVGTVGTDEFRILLDGDILHEESGGTPSDPDAEFDGFMLVDKLSPETKFFVPIFTVATLPTYSDGAMIAFVSDASGSTDCTGGGGSTRNLCMTDETAVWADVT